MSMSTRERLATGQLEAYCSFSLREVDHFIQGQEITFSPKCSRDINGHWLPLVGSLIQHVGMQPGTLEVVYSTPDDPIQQLPDQQALFHLLFRKRQETLQPVPNGPKGEKIVSALRVEAKVCPIQGRVDFTVKDCPRDISPGAAFRKTVTFLALAPVPAIQKLATQDIVPETVLYQFRWRLPTEPTVELMPFIQEIKRVTGEYRKAEKTSETPDFLMLPQEILVPADKVSPKSLDQWAASHVPGYWQQLYDFNLRAFLEKLSASGKKLTPMHQAQIAALVFKNMVIGVGKALEFTPDQNVVERLQILANLFNFSFEIEAAPGKKSAASARKSQEVVKLSFMTRDSSTDDSVRAEAREIKVPDAFMQSAKVAEVVLAELANQLVSQLRNIQQNHRIHLFELPVTKHTISEVENTFARSSSFSAEEVELLKSDLPRMLLRLKSFVGKIARISEGEMTQAALVSTEWRLSKELLKSREAYADSQLDRRSRKAADTLLDHYTFLADIAKHFDSEAHFVMFYANKAQFFFGSDEVKQLTALYKMLTNKDVKPANAIRSNAFSERIPYFVLCLIIEGRESVTVEDIIKEKAFVDKGPSVEIKITRVHEEAARTQIAERLGTANFYADEAKRGNPLTSDSKLTEPEKRQLADAIKTAAQIISALDDIIECYEYIEKHSAFKEAKTDYEQLESAVKRGSIYGSTDPQVLKKFSSLDMPRPPARPYNNRYIGTKIRHPEINLDEARALVDEIKNLSFSFAEANRKKAAALWENYLDLIQQHLIQLASEGANDLGLALVNRFFQTHLEALDLVGAECEALVTQTDLETSPFAISELSTIALAIKLEQMYKSYCVKKHATLLPASLKL